MQYLKDDVKNKIVQSALEEFRKYGYRGASMRNIAANAGIVSGNIYRYFKNKEDLFNCTVEPAYRMLDQLTVQFEKDIEDNSSFLVGDTCSKIVKTVSANILEVFATYSTEMMILFDKSEDTRYANTKERIKQVLNNALHNVYKIELQKHGKILEDDFILDVMASAFIDGVCMILRNRQESEQIKKLFDCWISIIYSNLYQRI